MSLFILIPAYEPDEKLIALVCALREKDDTEIVVVNDGSSPKCTGIFGKLAATPNCRVLNHPKNMGKGAAIKTGLRYMLDKMPGCTGCVTVDADGQHLPEDIQKVVNAASHHPLSLILGVRDFDSEIVPAKSKLGNKITRRIFHLLTNAPVSDTQTGLRAIPRAFMAALAELPGDRYEYEMKMLVWAAKNNVSILEIPIETVYMNQNRASHFNPVKDSFRIYKELLKYTLSSLTCSAIDIGIFSLLHSAASLFTATAAARVVSASLNFYLNRNHVFKQKNSLYKQAAAYFALCGVQMTTSWLLLECFTALFSGYAVVCKIAVDSLLFLVSFLVQRVSVFGKEVKDKDVSHI